MPIVIPDHHISRTCDVCRLVDNNIEAKPCAYCSLCDAYICEHCIGNWPRRIKAALKRKLEPDYKGLPNYVEISGYKEDQPSQ